MSNTIKFGRMRGVLVDLIRSVIEPRIDYLALYWGTVVAQSGMTLDVVPDNQALLGPGFQALTLATGAPQDTVTLDLTTKPRVLIGFAEGDPQKPYCALWSAGNLTARTIAGGANGAARNGDSVSVTLTVAEFAALAAVATNGGTTYPVTASAPVTLTGTITAGSSIVKIG